MRHVRLLVPVLLLTALLVYTFRTRPAERQAGMRHCAETSLVAAGLGSVAVEVDREGVRLAGSVVDEVDRDRAAAAAVQCGADAVMNGIAVAPQGPYTTTLCVYPGRLEISGTVPDRMQRSELLTIVTELLGDITVSTRLSLRAGAPQGYGRLLRAAFEEAPQLEDGCVEVVDRELAVRGRVRSAEVRDRLLDELRGAAGRNFALRADVDIPRLSSDALHCQDAFDALVSPGAHVLFDAGATELHEDGRALLDAARSIGDRCLDATIVVVGHTDDVGDATRNRDLSLRRAQAVVDYLVLRGLQRSRLEARGLGEAQPRASNETEAGRAANRRIELRVLEDRG